MCLHTILRTRGAGVRFIKVVVALAIRKFEQRRPKLTSRERWNINSWTHMYLSMKASRAVLRCVRLREELLTWCVIRNSLKYGRFATLNIPKCERFTLLVCPLRFLVISVVRRLRNVQSFKTYVFRFWTFCHCKLSPDWQGYPTWQTE